MIPAAIFSFLVGAVLAWGFRVWIIMPISLLAVTAAATIELTQGGSFASAIGHETATSSSAGFAPGADRKRTVSFAGGC